MKPLIVSTMLLLAAASPSAVADSSFGLGLQRKVIAQAAFNPANQTPSSGLYYVRPFGYRRIGNLSTDEGGAMAAPLDLPAGSLIENVCLFVYDNSIAGTTCISLRAVELGDVGHEPAEFSHGGCRPDGTTTAPGYVRWCTNPPEPILVEPYGDLDGDDQPGWLAYYLELSTDETSDDILVGPALVEYRKTVTPAPANATYDDVEIGNDFLQSVEALAAAGITTGCGVDLFCPDAPVTRAQFALMLARALGLHHAPAP